MKCKNCGKGRPKLWNKDGGFCDEKCYEEWKRKGCKICRLGTDLLIASYEVDPSLSNDILAVLNKHAEKAGHKPSEGWVPVD